MKNKTTTPFNDAVTAHKSLELSRALQDVKRLKGENSKLKLEIIELKQEMEEIVLSLGGYTFPEAENKMYEDMEESEVKMENEAYTELGPSIFYHDYHHGTNKTGSKAKTWFFDRFDIDKDDVKLFDMDVYHGYGSYGVTHVNKEEGKQYFIRDMEIFVERMEKGQYILVSGRWFKEMHEWDMFDTLSEDIYYLCKQFFIIHSSISGWVDYANAQGFKAIPKSDRDRIHMALTGECSFNKVISYMRDQNYELYKIKSINRAYGRE